MNAQNVFYRLRTRNGLSQDEVAEKVFVTRQAVSRWENGETVPNTDTLKLLSRLFSVSINTLLGEPRQLICQCCGMPLEEINALGIPGMPRVEKLIALVGRYINLEYRLPNGVAARFLDDQTTYLGAQLDCAFGGDRRFGVAANMDFILVCTYEKDGENPELVLYKKR